MLQTTVTINGQSHTLPLGHNVDALMHDVAEQVRAGGGFVELQNGPDRTVTVLVSPGMSMTVETVAVDDAAGIDPWPDAVRGPQTFWDSDL